MKAAAIIAEYDPFHNGHAYHIKKTRELYGADHVAVIMSGNFVQRGGCACVDSFTRADMAIAGGADLVVQLPLPWACAPAERFARGAAAIADGLGCIDILSFGSESGDIEALAKAAHTADSSDARAILKEKMRSGMSYPAARQAALCDFLPTLGSLLSNPNDTLGFEYIRALSYVESCIEPVCIKREGSGHNSTEVDDGFASASYLREILQNVELPNYIPEKPFEILKERLAGGKAPFLMSRLETAMLYRMRTMSIEEIAALPDISEGLENRIYRCVHEATSIDGLVSAVKTKRYTHSRLRRIMIYALLGVRKSHCDGLPPYIRIMAMNKKGSEMLSHSTLPLISRISDAEKLSERGKEIFSLELSACDIFALAAPSPQPCGSEAVHRMIIV